MSKQLDIEDVRKQFKNLSFKNEDFACFQDDCEVVEYLPKRKNDKKKLPSHIFLYSYSLNKKIGPIRWEHIKYSGAIPKEWGLEKDNLNKKFKSLYFDKKDFIAFQQDCKIVKFISSKSKENPKVFLYSFSEKENIGPIRWSSIKKGSIPKQWSLTIKRLNNCFQKLNFNNQLFNIFQKDCKIIEYVPCNDLSEENSASKVIFYSKVLKENLQPVAWDGIKFAGKIPCQLPYSQQNPLSNIEPGFVYHVICKKHSILCQKIGITRHGVKKRYSHDSSVEIVKVLSENYFEQGLFVREKTLKEEMKKQFGKPIFGNEYFAI